jgi:hypothetical protein
VIPANVDSVQEPRLTRHNQIILDMLREGPVTNVEIAKVSKNHTARISNIRAEGYDIRCDFLDRKTGLTQYTLVGRTPPAEKSGSKSNAMFIRHRRGGQLVAQFELVPKVNGDEIVIDVPFSLNFLQGDTLSTHKAA